MGIFSRTPKEAVTTTTGETVKTREELTAIAKGQRTGNFMDPGRGPAQSNGQPELVTNNFQ